MSPIHFHSLKEENLCIVAKNGQVQKCPLFQEVPLYTVVFETINFCTFGGFIREYCSVMTKILGIYNYYARILTIDYSYTYTYRCILNTLVTFGGNYDIIIALSCMLPGYKLCMHPDNINFKN